ncbi:hypothetical protein C0993_010262 [Termitomyces sp. T159_Od127]|nr:hypothetical protein C0993_010262 [Termitomyces sp. T159_Od127]
MCGFRPLPSIASSLKQTPEFAALIPQPIQDTFLSLSTSSTPTGPQEKSALRDLFEAVVTTNEGACKAQLNTLIERYKKGALREGERQDLADLVMQCNTHFPGDIGLFCVFLLNYVTLEPGEAIFLGAGEPHAYVSGECIECMANSDNVIRAGLTPKLRDIPNLISTLTYTASTPTKHYVSPSPFSSTTATGSSSTLYDPPIPEFSVVQLKLAPGAEESHRPVMGPSIMIVTDGEGVVRWELEGREERKLDIGLGDVFFIGAGTKVRFEGKDEEFVAYRAFVEVD